MGWKQPAENTHESLVKAMNNMDGVEFDLRLTADDQLVVHHDHIVSVSDDLLDGRSEYVEEWNLKDLEEVGFFYPEDKAESMKTNFRNMWSRMPLTNSDVQIFYGMLRQLIRANKKS